MTQVNASLKPIPFGQTSRRDAWWVEPLLTFLGLSAFIVYSTIAAWQGNNYEWGPYLSPMYSPQIFGGEHSWFGAQPSWWPSFLHFSPAFFILWAPAGFRLTCYYYRGAYYKAFVADPVSCAVGEPKRKYRGETAFPLILQNVHRYFLYLAIMFIALLAHDAWKAFWFTDASGQTSFGIGVGSLVLTLNACLLGGYTFGCHSLRHLTGGRKDCLSQAPLGCGVYHCVSALNKRHMLWAWMSLVWVGFTDFYVRMCAMGVWHDWRIL